MEAYIANLNGTNLWLIYGFLCCTFVTALFFVVKSEISNRFEIFVLGFFLLTGNYNEMLRFKIPGIDFLEIHSDRLLFLVLSFYLVRRFLFPGIQRVTRQYKNLPIFKLSLYIYVFSVILSQLTHISDIGFSEIAQESIDGLKFVVLVSAISLMADEKSILIIGRTFIIGAVLSSIISLIQLGFDETFMRLGESRIAFGNVVRCNGTFRHEYANSYFLIIAIFWTLFLVKKRVLKILLVGLLVAGVFSTFHRMSWLVLLVTMTIYFWKFAPPQIDRWMAYGLSGLALILTIAIFSYQDLASSNLVKDRLTDSIDGRKGYWKMVTDNIGDKPFFGFGSKDNSVYYHNMMLVTGSHERATGEAGDIHNGYLQAMFIFGIPSFVFLVLFVVQAILYFEKLAGYHPFFAVPFLVSVLFLFANLTNNLIFSKYVAILFAINLGLGMSGRYLKNFHQADQKNIESDQSMLGLET